MNFDTHNDENGANAGKRRDESAGRGAKNGLTYDGEEYLPNWGGYDGGVEASMMEIGKFVWKVSEKGANCGYFYPDVT